MFWRTLLEEGGSLPSSARSRVGCCRPPVAVVPLVPPAAPDPRPLSRGRIVSTVFDLAGRSAAPLSPRKEWWGDLQEGMNRCTCSRPPAEDDPVWTSLHPSFCRHLIVNNYVRISLQGLLIHYICYSRLNSLSRR